MAQPQLELKEVNKKTLSASVRAALQSLKVDAERVEAAANKSLVGPWLQLHSVQGSVEVIDLGSLHMNLAVEGSSCAGAFEGSAAGIFRVGGGSFGGALAIDNLSGFMHCNNIVFDIQATPTHILIHFFHDDWTLLAQVFADPVPGVCGTGFGKGSWHALMPPLY